MHCLLIVIYLTVKFQNFIFETLKAMTESRFSNILTVSVTATTFLILKIKSSDEHDLLIALYQPVKFQNSLMNIFSVITESSSVRLGIISLKGDLIYNF